MEELTLPPQKGPIYLQIVNSLIREIARGRLSPGDKLPSARELAVRLGVNPNTVIHAYSELERMGISHTRRGLGTYVRPDVSVEGLRATLLRKAAEGFWAEVEALGLSVAEALRIVEEVARGRSPDGCDEEIQEG